MLLSCDFYYQAVKGHSQYVLHWILKVYYKKNKIKKQTNKIKIIILILFYFLYHHYFASFNLSEYLTMTFIITAEIDGKVGSIGQSGEMKLRISQPS